MFVPFTVREGSCAGRHRRRRSADGVGHVVARQYNRAISISRRLDFGTKGDVLDLLFDGLLQITRPRPSLVFDGVLSQSSSDLQALQSAGRLLDLIISYQRGTDIPHPVPQSHDIIVRQRLTQNLRNGPDNLPILPRGSRWSDGGPAQLRPTFGVDPRDTLFGVCRSGEADVGVLGSNISVVSLVDDESIVGDHRGVEIVGVEEVDEFGRRLGGRGRWDETDVVGGGVRRGLTKIPINTVSFSLGVVTNEPESNPPYVRNCIHSIPP